MQSGSVSFNCVQRYFYFCDKYAAFPVIHYVVVNHIGLRPLIICIMQTVIRILFGTMRVIGIRALALYQLLRFVSVHVRSL